MCSGFVLLSLLLLLLSLVSETAHLLCARVCVCVGVSHSWLLFPIYSSLCHVCGDSLRSGLTFGSSKSLHQYLKAHLDLLTFVREWVIGVWGGGVDGGSTGERSRRASGHTRQQPLPD
jgi:hypothetical protein